MRELSNSGKFAMSRAHEIGTPSERCRICRRSFKVKFGAASQPGKSGYISSENLFKPSKRKDALGEILADTCRAVGFEVPIRQRTIFRPCV